MASILLLLLFVYGSQATDIHSVRQPGFKVRLFTQQVDHFGYMAPLDCDSTFQQRLFIYDKSWQEDGPILHYLGDEYDVETLDLGFLQQMADLLNGVLVIQEHRYYGESTPCGKTSDFRYLSVDQALADAATVNYWLKITLGLQHKFNASSPSSGSTAGAMGMAFDETFLARGIRWRGLRMSLSSPLLHAHLLSTPDGTATAAETGATSSFLPGVDAAWPPPYAHEDNDGDGDDSNGYDESLFVSSAGASKGEGKQKKKYTERSLLSPSFPLLPVVITFGGGYSGMLAANMRLKYPHIVAGAVASAAPMAAVHDLDQRFRYDFYRVLDDIFAECKTEMHDAFQWLWSERDNLTWSQVRQELDLCPSLDKGRDGFELLIGNLQYMIARIAEYQVPYALDGFPAYPANDVCRFFHNSTKVLGYAKRAADHPNREPPYRGRGRGQVDGDTQERLERREQQDQRWHDKKAEAILFSFRQLLRLFNHQDDARGYDNGDDHWFSSSTNSPSCAELPFADFYSTYPGMEPGAWAFQRCTEMILPFSVPRHALFLSGEEFPLNQWDAMAFSEFCANKFKVRKDFVWYPLSFGMGRDLGLRPASNILFSNGARDPWAVGSVLKSISVQRTLVAHQDMSVGTSAHEFRTPYKKDPESVTETRKLVLELVKAWIAEYKIQRKDYMQMRSIAVRAP